MNMQAVNQFKQRQREQMKKLKTDYANKLNNLKQAKRALQEDYDKENYHSNNRPISKNGRSPSNLNRESQLRGVKSPNNIDSSCYTSEDECVIKEPLQVLTNQFSATRNFGRRSKLVHNLDGCKDDEMYSSLELFQPRKRRDKSVPKSYLSTSLSRDRSRQSYFLGMGTSTYENDRHEKERHKRNKSFIRDVKKNREFKNLENDLQMLSHGFNSFLKNSQNSDIKDRFSILLSQSDALFETVLEHLCSLSLTKQQENKYKNIIAEYRESFKSLKISYCNERLHFDEQSKKHAYIEEGFRLANDFRHDLTGILKQGIHSIAS